MKISICKQCGIEISHYPSICRSFCSQSCKAIYQREYLLGRNNPNWKEDKYYYSNPHSLQRLIKRRDVHCQECGSKSNLQVHHKDRNHHNNGEDNLTLLCKDCHADEHIRMGQPELAKLIRSSRKYRERSPSFCVICGKEFTSKQKRVTCSRDCQKTLWSRNRKGRIPPNKGIGLITLTCHTCGKQFQRTKGQIKSTLVFCSHACQIQYVVHRKAY